MTGFVFDIDTLDPLPGANVYYYDANGDRRNTVTDDRGEFYLQGAEGRQCFASYVGYDLLSFVGAPYVQAGMTWSANSLPDLPVEGERVYLGAAVALLAILAVASMDQ